MKPDPCGDRGATALDDQSSRLPAETPNRGWR
jgi:hypothetical protein